MLGKLNLRFFLLFFITAPASILLAQEGVFYLIGQVLVYIILPIQVLMVRVYHLTPEVNGIISKEPQGQII